ncbi:MAG: arylsulfatase [Planctomycetaceae bacterium]|nr:arylsulfatase [Planctomycetaceae bacterium]
MKYLLSLWTCLVLTSFVSAAERPNIVIVMADDMGYSDLGCYGSEIETPNLDRLAANGLRFTQFYNTSRCCPTRAALLTGVYQHQAGIGHMTGNKGVPSYQGYLNDRCLTIAEALKPAGYRTLTTGKWHVGSKPGHWPLDRGFDRYFGTPSGGGVYFKKSLEIRKNVFFTLGNERIETPEDLYVTETFTDYAIQFVEEAVKEEQPFFLYLAHIAPHWPLQARPEEIAKYKGRYDVGWDVIRQQRYEKQKKLGIVPEKWKLSPRDPDAVAWNSLTVAKKQDLSHRMSVYAAQIDTIDRNVGRLVEALQKNHILDNTLLMFLSDNGCSAEGGPGGFSRGREGEPIGSPLSYASVGLEWANVNDTPYRQYKMNTHEGGIASPLIVHWPNGLDRQGELEWQVGHVMDLMPTCLDVAGAQYPDTYGGKKTIPLAGESLIPAMRGKPDKARTLFWEHEGNRSIREGDWKLVSNRRGNWELYHLREDRTELNDLAVKHPSRAEELQKNGRTGLTLWG